MLLLLQYIWNKNFYFEKGNVLQKVIFTLYETCIRMFLVDHEERLSHLLGDLCIKVSAQQ